MHLKKTNVPKGGRWVQIPNIWLQSTLFWAILQNKWPSFITRLGHVESRPPEFIYLDFLFFFSKPSKTDDVLLRTPGPHPAARTEGWCPACLWKPMPRACARPLRESRGGRASKRASADVLRYISPLSQKGKGASSCQT